MLLPAPVDGSRRGKAQILIDDIEKVQTCLADGAVQIFVIIAEKMQNVVVLVQNDGSRKETFQKLRIYVFLRMYVVFTARYLCHRIMDSLHARNVEHGWSKIADLAVHMMHVDFFKRPYRSEYL